MDQVSQQQLELIQCFGCHREHIVSISYMFEIIFLTISVADMLEQTRQWIFISSPVNQGTAPASCSQPPNKDKEETSLLGQEMLTHFRHNYQIHASVATLMYLIL